MAEDATSNKQEATRTFMDQAACTSYLSLYEQLIKLLVLASYSFVQMELWSIYGLHNLIGLNGSHPPMAGVKHLIHIPHIYV